MPKPQQWICKKCGAKTTKSNGQKPPSSGWAFGCNGSINKQHIWVKD